MKIAITGATGLVGKAISKRLIERGDGVIVLSRNPKKAKNIINGALDLVEWNTAKPSRWKDKLKGIDAVIHLAGENVMSKRWSEEHKQSVFESRVLGTRSLVEAISQLNDKPSTLITASAIGYYDNSINKSNNENSDPGKDFLADVTINWEKEAMKIENLGLRRASIRIGIILDKEEGALAKMITPFKFFIGGPLGSGKQWFPWVHIDDVVGMFLFALDNKNVDGVLNGVAPEEITMESFCKTLGSVMHRPSIFKVPSFVLKIILGEGADAVLGGSKIKPQRTLELGYKFKFENAETALKSLLR